MNHKNIEDLNVLIIGQGAEGLVEDTNPYTQFVQYRHQRYAEKINSLHMVVKALRNEKLKPRQLSDKLFTYPTLSKNSLLGLFDLYHISAQLIKKHDIDVIVTSDPFGSGLVGYLLKLRFRKPLCLQMFADYALNDIWQKERLQQRVVAGIARFLFKRSDTIRVISNQLKEIMVKKLKLIPERIFTHHIFVNKDQFLNYQGENIRSRLLGDTFKNFILTVARLDPQKDLTTLLKAARIILDKFPATLFLIVGDGTEKDSLLVLSRELELEKQVRFIGAVPYKEVPAYYHACDIFVLSSAYEDTARVLIEAALCAKPIVTTDTVGAREVVKDMHNGFVVPLKDSVALSEKIMFLLECQEKLLGYGKASQAIIKDMFDEEKLIQGIADMWYKTYLWGA